MKKILCFVMVLLMLMGGAFAERGLMLGDMLEVVNCNEFVTLREEPSTKAEALARIPLGGQARWLNVCTDDFTRVLYDGEVGYVLSRYLEPVSVTAIAYEDIDEPAPGTDEYYNINLFLSNFTEQWFQSPAGYCTAETLTDAELVQFAIEHIWYNRQDLIEDGEYGNGSYNVRLSDQYIPAVCEKYFGRAPENLSPLYMDYSGGYYYWQETGGHVPSGFAMLQDVRRIGKDQYRVDFAVYGDGYGWDESVCALSETEIAGLHPEYLSPNMSRGFAVINVGPDGSLADRSTWTLETYLIANNDWH
jgi:hypothetical protein